MDAQQPTQESQELDTVQPTPEYQAHIETDIDRDAVVVAQPTPDLEELGTLCSIDKISLTPEHQAHIAARGIKQEWGAASCITCDIPKATVMLGYKAQSPGIMLMSAEYGSYQLRPDNPWGNELPKYRSSRGDYDIFLPHHPTNPDYWKDLDALKKLCFTINGKPYLLTTEGGFKAIIGCQNDLPTIAGVGVTMFLTPKAKGEPDLVPGLKRLAEAGFNFIITFDSDDPVKKPETIKNVRRAEKRLTERLEAYGCDVLSVTGKWSHEDGKGMDDFIQSKGIEAFRAILEALRANLEVEASETPLDIRIEAQEKLAAMKAKPKGETPVWGQDTLAKYIAEKYRAKLAWHIDAQCWMRYEAENNGIWGEEPEEVVKSVVTAELDDVARRKAYGKHQAQIEEYLAQIEAAFEKGQIDVAQKLDQKIEKLEEKGPDEPPPYTHGFVSGVMSFTQSFLAVKHWDEGASLGLIPLKNGVFNYNSKGFSEHNSGNKITWTLPYDYNPTATCQPIEKWLEEMAGDKQVARLIVAYLKSILTNRTDIHRILELVGPGGSGKSTVARLAQALVGTQNTHTTTLAKLEGSRFETACLWNKRLAIVNDSERYAGNVTVLKAASGGDTIPHEVKFVQSRRGFIFDGKFILTSNEIIQSSDYTSGLERRRITIPFTNRIPVKHQRNLIEIKGDIVSGEFTEFLPGLFNLIVNMPDEEMEALLRDTETLCPALGESKAENLLDINPIAAWMDYCIIHDPDARTQIGLAIPDKDRDSQTTYLNVGQWLYPSYCEYSKNSGSRSPLGLQRFVKLLDDLAKNQLKLDGVEREKDRTKKSYFKGLRIRQDGTDDGLPSPIFGRASEQVRGDVQGDCGGMRGGMKPIQRRDAGDAEGLLKNSDNIFQDSPQDSLQDSPQDSFDANQILQNNAIYQTEFPEIPSASPAVPRHKDLNPPHIPPHIPPHTSAPPEPETPPPPAPTAQPIAPPESEPDPELVEQIVVTVQKGLAGDKRAIKEATRTIKQDRTGSLHLAVKARLSDAENEAYRSCLAKLKQSPPQPVESLAQPTDTRSQPELEAEPTGPEVVEDAE